MKPRRDHRGPGSLHGAGATLAIVLALGLAVAAAPGGGEVVLLDGPRGAWLGTLKEGAPLVVLEEKDGWRHVRLEGWVMAGAPITAPGEAPPPAPLPQEGMAQAGAGASVQGVLAAAIGTGNGPGAGVLTLLVR